MMKWSRVERDQAVLDGEADQAGGVVDLQLGHEVAAVLLDGLRAEVEVGGDSRVRVALGDELEDFPLAGGELIQRPEVREAQRGGHERGEDRPRYLRAEEGIAAADRPDGQEEFVGDRALEEVAFRPVPEGLPDEGIVSVHGEDEGPGFHFEVAQPPDGLHPVQVRHGDVEHEDVGEEPLDQREGLLAVGRFAYHFHIARLLQKGAEPLAD